MSAPYLRRLWQRRIRIRTNKDVKRYELLYTSKDVPAILFITRDYVSITKAMIWDLGLEREVYVRLYQAALTRCQQLKSR